MKNEFIFNPQLGTIYKILLAINSNKKANKTLISRNTILTYSHVLHLLEELHLRGLIREHQLSLRERNYTITETGKELLKALKYLKDPNSNMQGSNTGK